jgi:hypothetical protein
VIVEVTPSITVRVQAEMLAAIVIDMIAFENARRREGVAELGPKLLKYLAVVLSGFKSFVKELVVSVNGLSMLEHV